MREGKRERGREGDSGREGGEGEREMGEGERGRERWGEREREIGERERGREREREERERRKETHELQVSSLVHCRYRAHPQHYSLLAH